jgi:hypothetical protein
MTELISKDIVDLQDIEKVQFLQTLQADPSKYSQYVQEKGTAIVNETMDAKRAAFAKGYGDVGRLMDMDHNSQAALARTMDLANTQKQIIDEQAREEGSMKNTLNMTRRQVEINNWYYENKRETLFVLQLVLLVMLTVVIVLAMSSYGWINEAGANYLIGFVIVVGSGTWLYRWYYTAKIRDPMYWSRRYFDRDGKVAGPSGQICIGSDGEPVAGPTTHQPTVVIS